MIKVLWFGVLGSLVVTAVSAQTFSSIHSFTGGDGSYPYAGLVLRGRLLYGTTDEGGPTGARGTIYSLDAQGDLTVVAGLTADTGIFPEGPHRRQERQPLWHRYLRRSTQWWDYF